MRRVCIGVYFATQVDGLRQTLERLRANTPRSAALLLLVDGPDPTAMLELRAFTDVLQLPSAVRQGPASSFNRLLAATSAEALVFLESGALVGAGWLERMLGPLDSGPRNGLVLADAIHGGDRNSLILVRREVIRAIGSANMMREQSGQWIVEYCERARIAGFDIASAEIAVQVFQPAMRAPRFETQQRRTEPHRRASLPLPARITWSAESHRPRQMAKVHAEGASISIVAHFNVSTGYGAMSEYLACGMSRAGADVHVLPLTLNPEGLSEEFHGLLQRSRKILSEPVLFVSWPEPGLEPLLTRRELFMYTMWESSRLPEGWAQKINHARAVIVPTKFVANMFRESGVTAPIEVVPEGVDPNVYHLLDRPINEGVTTLIVGPIDCRKNVLKGVAAWKEAFRDDPAARLIIKTQYNYQNYVPDDPRIRYVDVNETTRGISHWYQQADVLLALGSEGFGLPMVEAMATGLPVIALNSEGQGDVCEAARDLLLPVSAASWETFFSSFGPCGVHGVPDVPEVTARLRWVADNRKEAQALGRAASQWVHQHRSVWAKGPAVMDVIEQHSRPKRAFRKPAMLWVPSWQTPCGIAEYTADLRDSLRPSVIVTAHEPDIRELRLLHIQHAGGLFDERQMTTCVWKSREAGVPVIVTEHAIDEYEQPWERGAAALVSLTQAGAGRLRARWPGKRIECIPHGCPTWFPTRKATRGKVIGAFGFLGTHKGFWHVLELLREIPGAELLLFAHSKSAELDASWEQTAAGLPVHRIREYLPSAEIARRLAAEADILAFWYDEVPHYSASGAVRIGLATGVPVLASPTTWFADLHDVTYQPANLFEGVKRLLEDTDLREDLTARARCHCYENSWDRVSAQHVALWSSLCEIHFR